jgi:glycosyltransferase involved in cell wall biosynthesis
MPPKPTIVLFFKGTGLGGAELNGLKTLEFLRQEGWSTRLITGSKGELFERFAAVTDDQLVISLPYPRKPPTWLLVPRFYLKVKAFLNRRSGRQVLLCGDFYELWAALLFRSPMRPVLSLWQGEYSFNDDSCVKKWLRYGAGRADKLLASSPVAEHANKTGVLPNPVHVLNPCIDETRFNPALYNRKELRERFGWAEGDHIAVCVGRIGEGKGQLWLAKTFVEEPRFPKTAKLVIVGPGSENDLTSLRAIEAQSRGRLRVTGPRDDIPEILAAADLAIQPGTLAESFGLAALEACITGVPLLAFKVGALFFTLGSEYPGLVTEGDRFHFTEKWIKCSKKNIPEWGDRMRSRLLSCYGKDVWKTQLFAALGIS